MAARVTSRSVDAATVLVRGWTRLYTWQMTAEEGEARRAEIESDLWEARHDPGSGRTFTLALEMLIRLIAGMPADLSWRIDHIGFRGVRVQRTIALTATIAIALAVWWLSAARQMAALPPLPASIVSLVERPVLLLPPPPPPPPPPSGRR
jgi:hypothetical protein